MIDFQSISTTALCALAAKKLESTRAHHFVTLLAPGLSIPTSHVPREGLEPSAYELRARSSAAELARVRAQGI